MIGELLFGAVACLLGGGLLFNGVRKLRSGVALSRNQTTPLREIPQSEGPVEFDGQVASTADHDAFDAPFSGEPAVCCQFWLEKASRRPATDDEEGLQIETSGEYQVEQTEVTWGLADTAEVRRSFVVTDGGVRVVVDPAEADLDVTGHMGEEVLKVGRGETLSDEVRARLTALDEFDGALDTWDDEASALEYREARLEPGGSVHVAGGERQSVPDEWGSGIEATVGESDGEQYLISRGTESEVVRRHLVAFVTGTIVGLALLGVGVRAIQIGLGG